MDNPGEDQGSRHWYWRRRGQYVTAHKKWRDERNMVYYRAKQSGQTLGQIEQTLREWERANPEPTPEG